MVLAAAATIVGLAPAASAAYGNEPSGPAWTPNGGVHAVVASGDTVYVGGSFTGGVAALHAETGALKWLGNANGDVRALALNGSQLLLGGAFTTVGGTAHRGLASVSAGTGAVNNTFKGAAGGTVRDIVVVGTTAYFGGAFTNHGGMAQQGLGAVDVATGALVTGFKATTNGTVYALGTDGSRLFFGGRFTTVDGRPRNELASITLASNTLDAWAPARACATDCTLIWDLTVRGDRVYTVGRNSGTLYTVHRTTGLELFRAPRPNGDSQAITLSPDGNTAYVGGHFVTVGGVTRMLVAEFDVSGTRPVLGAFSTRFVTTWPGVWAMASTASRLYVGGDFTAAGSKVNNQNKYPYLAMFPSDSKPPADTTAPTATTAPSAGATGVALNADVSATFSEPVQGVSGTTFTLTRGGTAVPATVTQGTGNQWVLNPNTDLAAGTQYTATLTGGTTAIRDLANNPFATTSWTFTTAAAPVDTTAPTATTAPSAGATGVALNADVSATFSEPVQGVSAGTFTLADAAGAAVPATVTQGTGNQWILNPNADLAAGTRYTATLTGGTTAIRDLANNPFATTSWTFTAAAAAADTTPPVWTGRIPSKDGATGVSRTANVTVAFDEQVQNVTTTTFRLTPTAGGDPVAATVSYNATSGRWVLNPSTTLGATTQYTAEVTNGVTDMAGNAFAGMTWSFTTGA